MLNDGRVPCVPCVNVVAGQIKPTTTQKQVALHILFTNATSRSVKSNFNQIPQNQPSTPSVGGRRHETSNKMNQRPSDRVANRLDKTALSVQRAAR